MYAGYGDYGANTGPIHLESVSGETPLEAWTDHVVADSEQIGMYRATADSRVLVPHIDPRNTSGGSGGGYSQRAADGTWTDLPSRIGAADVVHVFDLVEFAGDLWACGADNIGGIGGAAVWRSTNGGTTWTQSLVGPREPSADVTELHRFYCFVIAAGILRVRDPISGTSYKWTGSAWSVDTVNPLPTL